MALVGERFDGHEFLDAAVRQGARVLLVQRLYAALVVKTPRSCWWSVLRTRSMPWVSSLDWRAEDPRPVVAITGSAGKTTTRWALVQALEAAGVTAHTQVGNENNRIGVPRFCSTSLSRRLVPRSWWWNAAPLNRVRSPGSAHLLAERLDHYGGLRGAH